MPLPLQSELGRIEIITFCWCYNRVCLSDVRLPIAHNRLPTIIFIIYAHYRPTIFPLDRLQMRYTTVRPFILKMNEPPFAGLRLHESTLMRTVYLGLSLIQNTLHFIRSIYIF